MTTTMSICGCLVHQEPEMPEGADWPYGMLTTLRQLQAAAFEVRCEDHHAYCCEAAQQQPGCGFSKRGAISRCLYGKDDACPFVGQSAKDAFAEVAAYWQQVGGWARGAVVLKAHVLDQELKRIQEAVGPRADDLWDHKWVEPKVARSRSERRKEARRERVWRRFNEEYCAEIQAHNDRIERDLWAEEDED